MNIYAAAGITEFGIALGYKGEVVKDYFLNYRARNADFSVNLATGAVNVHDHRAPAWTVHLVDTGSATQTGGRVKRMANLVGRERFLLTYGDGVAQIDVAKVIAFHERAGALATLTAVRPRARFGNLEIEGAMVKRFDEKPESGDGWINGGFFVLEPEVFDFIDGDETLFEKEPLERIAAAGKLAAFQLDAFWQPMDTLREKRLLEELWESGNAPWKVWQ